MSEREVRRIYLKGGGAITTGIGLSCVRLVDRKDSVRVEVKGMPEWLDIPKGGITKVVR